MQFKYVDDLASVWCEWAEMELQHKQFKRALDLMRSATTTPVTYDRRKVPIPIQHYLMLCGYRDQGFMGACNGMSRRVDLCGRKWGRNLPRGWGGLMNAVERA